MRYSALPIVLAGLASAGAAQANSLTTFVSGTGVDSGACTAAAPCRTLQFAFARTKFDGVVVVVSSGSFGPVNITHSVSIVADGVAAIIQSRVACGDISAAICITGADQVTLRGLTIDVPGAASAEQVGIRFNSGQGLYVEKCVIRHGGTAIDFKPTSPASLYVSDSTLSHTNGDGILFSPQAGGNYTAAFDHVTAENNAFVGLLFSSASGDAVQNGVVKDSIFAGSGLFGIDVGGVTNLTIDRTVVSTNQTGIEAFGASTIVRIGDSTIAGNGTGVTKGGGGGIFSFGTNKLTANGIDGSFTGTIAQQ
jgi:hypothetical protein